MEEKPESNAERHTDKGETAHDGSPRSNDYAAVTDSGVSHAGGDEDGAGRVVLRDALDKGSPPPTSGDPSPGRNHVVGVIGHVSGAIDDKDGDRFEALAKSISNTSSGDPSRGWNTVSTGASVSVSSHSSSGHGVDGHGDDGEDVTVITSGRISTAASHGSKSKRRFFAKFASA